MTDNNARSDTITTAVAKHLVLQACEDVTAADLLLEIADAVWSAATRKRMLGSADPSHVLCALEEFLGSVE